MLHDAAEMVRGWLEDAGIAERGSTLPSLRRFAAARWLQNGLSIRQTQVLLGHTGPETTARYLNYDLTEIANGFDVLLPAIENARGGPGADGQKTVPPSANLLQRLLRADEPGGSDEGVTASPVLVGLTGLLALAGLADVAAEASQDRAPALRDAIGTQGEEPEPD